MAPKWTYVFSVADIIDAPEAVDDALDGRELCWQNGAVTIQDTSIRWHAPPLMLEVVRDAGTYYRVRLYIDDGAYGVHIDVHSTKFATALGASVAFAGEVTLARLLYIWRQNIFFQSPRLIAQCAPRQQNYVLRRRLTACQEQALTWMMERESLAADVAVCTAIAIPNSDFVFSHNARAFVPRHQGTSEAVQLRYGVVAGARRSGKPFILRRLLDHRVNRRHCVELQCTPYPSTSTLIIVPPHTVRHWTWELRDVHPSSVTSAAAAATWRPSSTANTVVITYAALRQYLYSIDFFTRAQQVRRRACATNLLEMMVWDRVVFDEFVEVGGDINLIDNLHAHYVWIFQGGATAIQERNVLSALYDTVFVPPELLRHACCNTLPALFDTSCASSYTTVTLIACDIQKRLWSAMGDVEPAWGVTARFRPQFTFHHTWDDIVRDGTQKIASLQNDAQNDAHEPPAERPRVNSDRWSLAINYNGLSMVVDITGSEFDMELETASESGSDTDAAAAEQPISEEFFKAQVLTLRDAPPICDVCSDRSCDVVTLCGHLLCLSCAVQIVNTNPRCSHCRFVLKKDSVFVRHASYTPVAHTWMQSIAVGKESSTMFVASNAMDTAYLQKMMSTLQFATPATMIGRPLFDIEHVVLLDDTDVPPNVYHPHGLHVTRLQVRQSAVDDGEMN